MCASRVEIGSRHFQKELFDGTGYIGECFARVVCVGNFHGPGVGDWHRDHGVGFGDGLARARATTVPVNKFITSTVGSLKGVRQRNG